MLRKLLKYEIKATARTFLPLYLVLIVFALINILISSQSPSLDQLGVPFAISMMLYMIILIGTCVMTVIVMIQRFYKNFLNDEGYLMFTLPVQTWKHITSKLLVSMMWAVLSAVIALASILILAMGNISWSELTSGITLMFEELYKTLGVSLYIFIIQIALFILVSLITNILMIYVSIALGHLLNHHRILASIGAYFCIYTVTQILISILITALFGTVIFDSAISASAAPSFIQSLLWFSIIFSTILGVGYYVTTNIILSKRLNLE